MAVGDSARPTITGNDFDGTKTGIWVRDSAAPTISGNEVYENEMFGIRVSDAATATMDGREVTGP